ncbi:MAG: hypothetical protein AB8F74_04845 [Saprospiraceae bacterium]
MNFSNPNYRRWFIQGTIGILLLGSGLSMVVESGFYKQAQPTTWKWVLAGTLSLVVFMSGLILMVDSIRYRIAFEKDKKDKLLLSKSLPKE